MNKQDVINYFGGVEAAAKACRVSRQTIWRWPSTLDWHQQCIVQVASFGAFKVSTGTNASNNTVRARAS